MGRLMRVVAVLAMIWSALVTGFLVLLGAAFSMTDRFNGPMQWYLQG